MRLYESLKPWWDKSLLDQRVVCRWQDYLWVVHPMLKPKLRRMWAQGFIRGEAPGYARPNATAGRTRHVRDDLVHWGLGIRVRGGHRDMRKSLARKLEWAGLVRVSKTDWVVPEETIVEWIRNGEFVLDASEANALRVCRTLARKKESNRIAKAMDVKHRCIGGQDTIRKVGLEGGDNRGYGEWAS